MLISETDKIKRVRSKKYNYEFNKKTGFFARWGKKTKDDPLFSPFGPEIADIEITTSCTGLTYEGKNHLCKFCYKSNTPNGENMSFETFKKMIDNFPSYEQNEITATDLKGKLFRGRFPAGWTSEFFEKVSGGKVQSHKSTQVPFLTQVAFGADSKAESNPDLWKMMDYCREKGIIPNITVAQISDETADKLVAKCGAVAVSRYENKDICYDTVKKLTDRGLDQVNIHCMISEETFDNAWETLQDRLTDPRLEKLKAIVFLSLKKKGRGESFTPLAQDKFKKIVDFAMDNHIGIGFDSCSAFKYLQSVKDHPNYDTFEMCSEPCESSAFSIYCNTKGEFYPCSFSEEGEFGEGLDVVNCDDFMEDIWNHPKTKAFRKGLLATAGCNSLKCRECPLFEV
jgi:hypothetical protein